MQIGMVGLGRMGANMTTRLIEGGHSVVVFDRSPDAVATAAAGGAVASTIALGFGFQTHGSPKAVWIMVPSGRPTDDTIDELSGLLGKGGVIIDGGNTNWKDGLAAYEKCKAKGVSLVDAGTSGGVWGFKEGYCLMVGGDDAAVKACRIRLSDARAEGRICACRAGRIRPLLEDGAQRHRVRLAAGVWRRL